MLAKKQKVTGNRVNRAKNKRGAKNLHRGKSNAQKGGGRLSSQLERKPPRTDLSQRRTDTKKNKVKKLDHLTKHYRAARSIKRFLRNPRFRENKSPIIGCP